MLDMLKQCHVSIIFMAQTFSSPVITAIFHGSRFSYNHGKFREGFKVKAKRTNLNFSLFLLWFYLEKK